MNWETIAHLVTTFFYLGTWIFLIFIARQFMKTHNKYRMYVDAQRKFFNMISETNIETLKLHKLTNKLIDEKNKEIQEEA